MIGDGILTDIPGGIAAGMPTVYVASAIHHDGALYSDALSMPTSLDEPCGYLAIPMDNVGTQLPAMAG